ncbi:MAG: TonB-dependent siderophore receptor [Flavobacterium sp.]|nr:TonB-dependent siderophore receptor [Flavobacterium sp.]
MKYLQIQALLLFATIVGFAQQNDMAFTENDTIKNIENDTVRKRKTRHLQEISIHARHQKVPVSVVRSGLKPMDTPQSLQVIGTEIISQQQSIRLSEVIKNANGVYVSSARGGAQESFFSRGYDMSANNMFKNGFRFNSGSIPEVSSLEKVEFLKGGSALLYGNVAPGGILNLVTKTPSFKHGGEISMQAGSYAYYKPSIDIYGPLSQTIAYRFTGSYENAESFRDVVKNERFYFNPSFLFKITNKTQITVQGDYLNAEWTPDFGTGIINKEILNIPRNTYFGALWSTGKTNTASASVLVNHDFNKNWKLNFNSSYQSYQRESKSTSQLADLGNTKLYPIPGYWKRGLVQNKNLEQIFGDQLSLQGTFNTGSIKHQIFTGVDYEKSFATAYTFVFYNDKLKTMASELDAINLFNYDPSTQSLTAPFPSRPTQIVNTDTQRFGAYAQDLISFTEKIKLLAGIRWSWQESEATTYKEVLKVNAGATVPNEITTSLENAKADVARKRLDRAFTPKVGLVYQPTKDMSFFGSYSSSFTPNTGLTINKEVIEASIIDQYEVGVKKDFWKGALSTNVTLYQIMNSNLAQTAPYLADGITPNVDSNIKMLGGGTKSKGIELDITAKPIEGLNIIAGYSYNDMRYTKTSGTHGSFITGDRVARTPQNTANLSFFYTLPSGLLKGISFGAIGNYVGDRLGGWNDDYQWKENSPSTTPKTYTVTIRDRDIPLEGYATVDASVGYTWKKFSILCKLSNVTNKLNYTVHENYSVNPIAPRQIMTSLKYKF